MKQEPWNSWLWCLTHPHQMKEHIVQTEKRLEEVSKRLSKTCSLVSAMTITSHLVKAICENHRVSIHPDMSMNEVVFLIRDALSEREDLIQENESLKNANQRLQEKVNLLTPAGLR